MIDRIRDISIITLLCNDLERMKEFYTEIMQFPIYTERERWLELRVGSTLLALRPRGRGYDGEGGSGAAVHLSFRMLPDEVDSCYKELTDLGVDIIDPPAERTGGLKTMVFKDPENNLLTIYADMPKLRPPSILTMLNMAQVVQMSPHTELLTYEPGETIVEQGDIADKFYLITSGRVKVINRTKNGQEIIVDWLASGEYFGEVGLLQSHPRTATIRAADDEPVKVIALTKDGFQEMLAESEKTSQDISKAMYDRLMNLATKIVEQDK